MNQILRMRSLQRITLSLLEPLMVGSVHVEMRAVELIVVSGIDDDWWFGFAQLEAFLVDAVFGEVGFDYV